MDDATKEEDQEFERLSPIAALRGSEGYRDFKDSILDQIATRFLEFMEAPTDRLQSIQGEVTALYYAMGVSEDAAGSQKAILARIEGRREAAAQMEWRTARQETDGFRRRAAGSVPL